MVLKVQSPRLGGSSGGLLVGSYDGGIIVGACAIGRDHMAEQEGSHR